MADTIPLGLYIHIPWCERKCPYCDFNSHVARAPVDEADYVDALIKDLDHDLSLYVDLICNRPLQSIFIGGGTPSLFSAQSIDRLISKVRQRIAFAVDIEITLEANPGSAERQRFEGFASTGINRLSIGVQSFENNQLASLGRIHDADQAVAAASHAAELGINFNLDLMYGLPEQSEQQAFEELETAIALKPNHLSCYQLTIEPNTAFYLQPPPQPSNEILWQMQIGIQQQLARSGYQQYEVSAYAQEGSQCQHNLNYWRFGDYLGIGAGAHGKLSDSGSGVHRYWKIKHPATYIGRCNLGEDPAGSRASVEQDQLAFEFMLNALRLTHGFHTSLIEQRTFGSFADVEPILKRHQELGLLTLSDDFVIPTSRGKSMIDTMLQDYLP